MVEGIVAQFCRYLLPFLLSSPFISLPLPSPPLSSLLHLQQWSDIIREVKFLYSCDHENCIRYKGCYLKDMTCWVSIPYAYIQLLDFPPTCEETQVQVYNVCLNLVMCARERFSYID